jgi:hypothetical protein
MSLGIVAGTANPALAEAVAPGWALARWQCGNPA